MKSRAYGWVQNPSDFAKLKLVVQIFDAESEHYKALRNSLIQNYIAFSDIKGNLLTKIEMGGTTWSYAELVGSSKDINRKPPTNRKDAVADSLIQITVLPQSYKTKGKRWTDNWTADGFLRWAVSLGFLTVDSKKDLFSITPKGLEFSKTENDSEDEKEVLRGALLAYPPAVRVLEILNDAQGVAKNKFYIGNRLGFKGEKGFTSYDEELMRDWLKSEQENKARTTIKQDVEGTSDKYARMISGWLVKVGFLEQKKSFEQSNAGKISGFPEYLLTGKGTHAFRQTRNGKIPKFIMWEFLATDGEMRDYNRTRRTYILKILSKTSKKSFESLLDDLKKLGFDDNQEIIKNDIKGLQSIGLRIKLDNNKIEASDSFLDFNIPELYKQISQVKNIPAEKRKEYFISTTSLDIKYLELLEIAFDGKRNRDFEILTAELFKNVIGLNVQLLGGGRKPDVVAYTDNFGIIIDTKAYSTGYSKSITEEDKMVRYMEDNIIRSAKRNNTLWWETFPDDIHNDNFHFLWVSSKFNGRFSEQIKSTSSRIQKTGAVINIEQLLFLADRVSKGVINVSDIPKYFKDEEIQITSSPIYSD